MNNLEQRWAALQTRSARNLAIMGVATDTPDPNPELVTTAVLAKLGIDLNADIPDAPLYDWTQAQRHDARKSVRRAINAIVESTRTGGTSPQDARIAAEELGQFVARVERYIDLNSGNKGGTASLQSGDAAVRLGPDQWRDANGKVINALSREDAGNVATKLNAGAPDCTLGDFFRGVAGLRTSEAVRAALSVGTDGSGGYAVPSRLWSDFIEALIPVSSVLQAGAKVLPLDASAKQFRLARIATVPTAAWRAEAGNVSESDPTFTALDLVPKSLAFFFKVSRELLADAPNIDAILRSAIAGAFAKEFDRAALRGSGTGNEPTGLLNQAGIASVTNGANGATQATIKWASINSAYQAILDANGPVPTAVIQAPRTLVGFSGLADSTGQPLRRPSLLEPMQFIATSQIPVNLTVGTSNDCTELYVGHFPELVVGLREDVTVMRADQLYAGTGQVAFFCHARADVGLLHAASFAKITGVRA